MNTQYQYEEYTQNREEHEDYYTIMEEYSQTELFEEIIHFMDIAFPEWKSNKGIGFWAGEFVLTAILNNDHLEDRTVCTQREMLIDLYLELVSEYKNTKAQYEFIVFESIINKFENDKEFELEENEHLSVKEYSVFYDELFSEYKKLKLEEVTYNFEDERIC